MLDLALLVLVCLFFIINDKEYFIILIIPLLLYVAGKFRFKYYVGLSTCEVTTITVVIKNVNYEVGKFSVKMKVIISFLY